ncbi:isoprenylcysteine carboxylmethyltransferase family protein [Mycolicibacterium novocastrense]|nr:isoprenylcysteine carboxylmethyltransferase family protein [Mycolicibacterium novocastrense]
MAIAALILFAVFIVLAGGARPILQRRRTGDTGIRGFSARPSDIQWWAHYGAAVGGLATGIGAPLAELIGLAPLGFLDHPISRGVGLALAVLGILATFAAQLAMGASWRIAVDRGEQTTLITGGPFRVVRNPIFSAMVLAFLGLTLMVPNLIAVVGFVVMLIGNQAQVRLVEEPYLRQLHGAAYADYAARVGRFLPGIGRLRSG